MRFTKMHGIGNDYVYVNCFKEAVRDPSALAAAITDRHFGVGGDGLILIMPSKVANVRMRMFNADGSEGLMCGNGVRCVAKYAHDHKLTAANPMTVETAAGIKTIQMKLDIAGRVSQATVDMGEPILAGPQIPVMIDRPVVLDYQIDANGDSYKITCVSMGNPHAVMYVDDAAAIVLERVGPSLETHPLFPQRVNVHFVQVYSPSEVIMRTWERGSGATMACGTGASAACVAGVLTGRTGRMITAHLPGGDLLLEWRQENNRVYMTGPAAEVFSGEWPADR